MQPYGNETKRGVAWDCDRRYGGRRRSHDWPRARKEWREQIRVERHLARHVGRREIAFELAAGETMAEAVAAVERAAAFGMSIMSRRDVTELERALAEAERNHASEVAMLMDECAREHDHDHDHDDFARFLLTGSVWDDPDVVAYYDIDPVDDYDIDR